MASDFGDEVGGNFNSGFNDGRQDDPFGIGNFGDPFQPGGQDFTGGGTGGGGFNFDWESLVNLFLGLAVGYQNSKNANQTREDVQKQIERARAAATPENFINVFKTLQPIMKEIVASGAGPQLSGAILSGLAKSGGKDTGRGMALAAAGASAGDLLAINLTQAQAGQIQAGQIGAELGVLPTLAGLNPASDPLLSALVGGAAGYFGTSALNQKQNDQPQDNKSLFPNLRP